MIVSTRMWVRIADLYFDEPMPVGVRADIVRYNQFSRPVVGAICRPASTMLLDLFQTPEEMLSKMKSHTRYKIRRAAEKDELSYEHSDGKDGYSISKFAEYYDHYAAMKGLGKVSRKRYAILAQQNALDLSFMYEGSDLLVVSSYLMTPSRVRGLHLAAAFRGTSNPSRRSLIGRANRYLRWRDILRFREVGIKMFDFGGWYLGEGDAVRTNELKAEFCGQVTKEFTCQSAMTVKGRLVLVALERQRYLAMRHFEVPRTCMQERDNDERPLSASV